MNSWNISQRASLFHKDEDMLFNLVLRLIKYNDKTNIYVYLLTPLSAKALSARVRCSCVILWNLSTHVFTKRLLYTTEGLISHFSIYLYILLFGTSIEVLIQPLLHPHGEILD